MDDTCVARSRNGGDVRGIANEEYLCARGKRIYLGHAGNIHGTRTARGSGNRDRHGWRPLNNIYECSWCRVGGGEKEERRGGGRRKSLFKSDFFFFFEKVVEDGLMEDSTKERCVSILFFFFFSPNHFLSTRRNFLEHGSI